MPAKWVKDSIENSPETKLHLKETEKQKRLEGEKKLREERRVASVIKTLNAFSGWSAISKFANDFDILWVFSPSNKLPTYTQIEDDGYERPQYNNHTYEGFQDIFIQLDELDTSKYIILKTSYSYDDKYQECKIVFTLRFGGSSVRSYSVEQSTPISADTLYDFLRRETIKFINASDHEEDDKKPFWKSLFS